MNRPTLFKRFLIVAALTGLLTVAHADNTTTLPPVRAVLSDLGTDVLCYGYECAGILNVMAPPLFVVEYATIADTDVVIDHGEFCRQLKDKKPPGCDLSSPPSTPDTDANWQPNGCGNNWRVQAAMQLGIMAIVPDEFAGNFNAPYSGVSFLGACNRHDQCYGLAFDKAFCDSRFGDEMTAACGVVASSAGHNVCDGLAGIYKGAVAATTFGNDAYASSVKAHTCAVWVKDMNVNGCPR